MRIYHPKNEQGQHILNEGQLVSSSTSVTKSLTGGAITLTNSDMAGIANWTVKAVYCTIKGQEMSFSPQVTYGLDGITLRFSHDGENIEGLTGAKISLQLSDSQGFVEQELSIEVLLEQALSSGDNTKVDQFVDKVIVGKDKDEIQTLGAKLAKSGIEEYTLAGAKTGSEAVELMTRQNMGVFSSPIASLGGSNLILNDTEFAYNMMSLENNIVEYTCGMFVQSNLTSFSGELPSLTDGVCMFSGCYNLTSFVVDLPKLTNGSSMFSGCYNLTSFTSNLPKLTNGTYMFASCSLTAFASDLPSLTNGHCMFFICYDLSSFTSELLNLRYGEQMFYDCTNLTSFTPWGKNDDCTPKDTGATGNLTTGYYMFHKCKLDLISVKRIADWLPQRTGAKPTGGESSSKDGWIHIGVASGVNTGTEFNNAISKMTSKNWSVVICVNGAHTTK